MSAFVGDQFGAGQTTLLRRIYGWFYWIINLGSFASKILVPLLLLWRGPRFAFALPGVLMAVALAVFWAGRKHFVLAPPTGPNPHGLLRVVASAARRIGTGAQGQHWLDGARDRHPEEAIDGAKAVFRIMGVFAAVTLFWALFDQKGSSWVFQARQLDLTLFGRTYSPAQLQALNPALVLVLVPLFTWVVFPALERRGVVLEPLRKMTWGMFVTVLSFVAAAVLQMLVDAGRAPHALWQVPQYLLLTAGEVLVSVTGLEFSYTQAPRSMRSTIMSIWFLTVFLGNLLTALVTRLVRVEGAAYFWMFAALMLAAALLFRAVARRYAAPPKRGAPAAPPDRAAGGVGGSGAV